MIRLQDIKAPLDTRPEEWPKLIAERLRIRPEAIREIRLTRKSVDARDKNDVHFVLTLDIKADREDLLLRSRRHGVSPAPVKAKLPDVRWRGKQRPLVVGTGPSGLFAALILARAGARPLLIDRGHTIRQRVQDVERFQEEGVLDPESNVQFGEGGAGTFSDGKLTTGIKSPWSRFVLETFASHGAPSDILTDQKPHIGTDILQGVVASMREEILRQGGEVKFACRLDSLLLRMGAVEGGILVETGKDPETFLTNTILLAIGHSARDTMRSLFGQGIRMVQKPFAVGVRIEHPQEMISRSQYGGAWNHPALGPAPYKLSVRTPDGRGVYTFCMCPGGEVIAAASQPEGVAVNGMSRHDRGAANANAALLTGIRPDDFGDSHPLAGFAFQRSMERAAWRSGGGAYQAPAQRVEDFLQGKASSRFGDVVPSYRPGVTPADLRSCLPGFVTDNLKLGILEMDRQLHGFAMADAVLTGVETRSSSPVRLPRDQRMMAEAFDGLFPVGEGAGYAGGIVSAAVDGINAAIAACERSAI